MAIDQKALRQHTNLESAHLTEAGNDPKAETPMVKGILAKARERLADGFDATTILPEMRKKWGIGEDESLAWKRDELHVEQWRGVAGNQSLDHWLSVMEGRVVTIKNEKGQQETVRNGDLILCAYPASIDREFEAIQKENLDKYIFDTQKGDYRNARRYRDTMEELEGMREYERSQDSGMLGEWQGQRDWERVMDSLGVEKVAAIMAEHRGSRMSAEDMSEARIEAKEREERGRDSGGKFTSIPSNVRPKNFAGAKR